MMRFLMLAALAAVLPALSTFALPAEAQPAGQALEVRGVEARAKAKAKPKPKCHLKLQIS